MRTILLACAVPLALSACGSMSANTATPAATSGTTLPQPLLVNVVQDASIALASYQAALGVMDVALQSNPALKAKADALAAKAAPFVAAAQTGTVLANMAPNLGALAAELLVEAAPYIAAVPNKA